MNNRRINLGIIGLGRISSEWIGAAKSSGKIDISCGCDADSSKRNLYPGLTFYNNTEKMLETEKQLDAIIVSTSSSDHYETGLKVIRSGNNLVMEKPSAFRMEDFLNLRKLSAEHLTLFYNAFHFMFAEELIWFLQHKDEFSDRFGDPSGFSSMFNDPYALNGKVAIEYQSLSGSWVDSGINALSVLHKIFEENHCLFAIMGQGQMGRESGTVSEVLLQSLNNKRKRIFGSIFTSWTSGTNIKVTNVFYPESVVQLNHTKQSVEIFSSNGESEVKFMADMPRRLSNHYAGLVSDLYKNIIENTDNSGMAFKLYAELFSAFNLGKGENSAGK
ncbi:MAG: Gfo/Idh/MocA family oxidoreductase [Candidatus Thermoplasmatota archaeon]|nr:Gfo/Idh/MocA family oxidoreductase [Candidatus Thermoplasmatota archaeon]